MIRLLFCCWLLSSSLLARPVWVDTDIIFTRWGRDVDDGIALMVLLSLPEVEIRGISTVIEAAHGAAVTRRILRRYDRSDIPVYAGAEGPADLGHSNPAVEAMAAALQQERLTILALGPMTNVTTLLRLHPELRSQIIEIVSCAGRSPDRHFQVPPSRRYLPDYNLETDSTAFAELLAQGLPLRLAGFEAADSLYLSKADLAPLRRNQGPDDRWVHRQLRRWRWGWHLVFRTKRGFIPFDAATVAAWLYPEACGCQPARGQWRHKKNDAEWISKGNEKPYLFVSPSYVVGTPLWFCTRTPDGYHKEVVSAVLRTPYLRSDHP